MPQLPQAMQESAQAAASENASREFKPLDEGVYTARLSKVEATRSKGNPTKGTEPKPMWALEFDEIQDYEGKKKPGRLWSNLTIEDSTAWKIAQFFDAFGVPSSINTDEIINYRCRLQVTQRLQTVGKNAGKTINEITRFVPLVESDMGFDAAQKLAKRLGGASAAPAPKAIPAAATVDADADEASPVAVLQSEDQGVDF